MMENGDLHAFRTVPIVLVTRSVILLMDTVLRAVRRDGHCQVVTQVFFLIIVFGKCKITRPVFQCNFF